MADCATVPNVTEPEKTVLIDQISKTFELFISRKGFVFEIR